MYNSVLFEVDEEDDIAVQKSKVKDHYVEDEDDYMGLFRKKGNDRDLKSPTFLKGDHVADNQVKSKHGPESEFIEEPKPVVLKDMTQTIESLSKIGTNSASCIDNDGFENGFNDCVSSKDESDKLITDVVFAAQSTSLPDLTLISSAETTAEKTTVNSFANICRDNLRCQEGREHQSSGELLACRYCQQESSTDTKSLDESSCRVSQSMKWVVKKRRLPPIELTLCVSPPNNRLSQVLESIPLVYIPHTKQLLSAGEQSDKLMPSCLLLNPSQLLVGKMSADFNNDRINKTSKPMKYLDRPTSLVCRKERSSSSFVDKWTVDPSDSDCSTITKEDEMRSSLSDLRVSDPKFRDISYATETSITNSTAANHKIPTPTQAKDVAIDLDLDTFDRLESPLGSLQRAHNSGFFHPVATDGSSSFSSMSSIISTGTELSLSMASVDDQLAPDDAGFMDINLHSRNTFDKFNATSQDSEVDEKLGQGAKPKRRGITFLARSLFSKKSKDHVSKLSGGSDLSGQASSPPGWKLFGKVPPKLTHQKDPGQDFEQLEVRSGSGQNIPCPSPDHIRKRDIEVTSTTALILENRPMNLPPKPALEAAQHKQEYHAIVEAARKKELKEAKLRKRHIQHQLKVEERQSAAVKVWNTVILPNWENMRNSKRARDLWWLGIPPSVRGKVWKLAIGNELNVTQELYEICLSRAKDRLKILDENGGESDPQEESSNKESSVELIFLDVSRTFPQLCIFQKGGPYHDMLHSLLGAYACYRPDVGYVQGMSFVAAVLLLNMDVADAFICFANLLNKPCQLAFFRVDENLMKLYFLTYEEFFMENLPKLYQHFKEQKLTPDLYINDWMFSLFSRSLPLDIASRVWDIFCRDGEESLFRTALDNTRTHARRVSRPVNNGYIRRGIMRRNLTSAFDVGYGHY